MYSCKNIVKTNILSKYATLFAVSNIAASLSKSNRFDKFQTQSVTRSHSIEAVQLTTVEKPTTTTHTTQTMSAIYSPERFGLYNTTQ